MVSDLHIGTLAGVDLVRRPELRAALTDRLRDGIDRLVILGDGLELREQPADRVLAVAEPVLADLGRAVGEIVLVGGNHDHNLHGAGMQSEVERLSAAARPARLTLAYPGIRLREDVYALHGHYLDLHNTTPTIERLVAGTMARAFAPIPERASFADYEAVLAPLYAWMYALAQHSKEGVARAGSRSSARAWVALAGAGRHERPVRAVALNLGLRSAVGVLNRTGIGPFEPRLSGPALRRGGLAGVTEALQRLDITDPYVLFGHTHRSGPWAQDDPGEWRTASGTRLINTGSWVYQRHFLPPRPGTGPYWPGTAVFVGESGPPVLEALLADRTHAQLRPEDRA